MAQLIYTMLLALFRIAVFGICGSLIERGIWTDGQVEQLAVGLFGFLVAAVWALWTHYKSRIKFLTALQLPAGTNEKAVDAKIKRGAGASL